MTDGETQAAAQPDNRLLILDINIAAQGGQAQRTVHCARIQMKNAEPCCHSIRHRAFSGADWSVYSDIQSHGICPPVSGNLYYYTHKTMFSSPE